jgi:hypothetical protein
MKDLESQFQEHSKSIRIQPHPRTWERVEGKLRVHRSKGKVLHARLITIAAALALLITVAFSIYFIQENQQQLAQATYTMSIEELHNAVVTGEESIYDVEKIRQSYKELID